MISHSPNRFELTTTSAQTRWLVVSESNLPHWEITIDGEPTTSYLANYLYQGIIVPPGKHRISMQFPGMLRQSALGSVKK